MDTKEELLEAMQQKFNASEAEMTGRLEKLVKEMKQQKEIVASTLELSCGSFTIWKREQEYQTSSLLAEITNFTENKS